MNVEDWKKNTINGQIASKMVEIVKPRGEKVYMSNDFAHSIEYQGREFDVGLIVTGVEVGDIPDDDDYTYTVYLGDFAVCEEFRDATISVMEERGKAMVLSDYISLEDCVLALGEDYKDLGNAISEIKSEFRKYHGKELSQSKLYNKIIGLCALELDFYHCYKVEIKYNRYYLYVNNPITKWDIVYKKPSFIEVMEKIKNYLVVKKC